MANIFISYRHADCGTSALSLYNELRHRFPIGLMDPDFQPGDRLPSEIDKAISCSCALLVLIGRTWLDPRLKDPHDWIRREIRCARRNRVRLQPVLVDGAAMPKREELPSDVDVLSDFKAIELRYEHFQDDLYLLVRELDRIIASDQTRLRRIDAAAKKAFRTYAKGGTTVEPLADARGDHSDSPEKVTRLIRRYYSSKYAEPPGAAVDFRRFRSGNMLINTTIAAQRGWTGLTIPLYGEQECCTVIKKEPPAVSERVDAIRLRRYIAALTGSKIRLWDDHAYRLLDIKFDSRKQKMEATFGVVGFLEHRFSMGLLNEETMLALADTKGDVDKVIKYREELLPLRGVLLPNRAGLLDFGQRIRIGGVEVLFAMARRAEADFCFLTNMRGSLVSTGRGRLGILPMGYHQHVSHAEDEVQPSTTVFREVMKRFSEGRKSNTARAYVPTGSLSVHVPSGG